MTAIVSVVNIHHQSYKFSAFFKLLAPTLLGKHYLYLDYVFFTFCLLFPDSNADLIF